MLTGDYKYPHPDGGLLTQWKSMKERDTPLYVGIMDLPAFAKGLKKVKQLPPIVAHTFNVSADGDATFGDRVKVEEEEYLYSDYTTVVLTKTSDTTLGPSDTTDVKVWQKALLEAARSVKEGALPFTEAAQPLLLDTVVYAHEAAGEVKPSGRAKLFGAQVLPKVEACLSAVADLKGQLANLIANADEEADQARVAQHDVTALRVTSMFHTVDKMDHKAPKSVPDLKVAEAALRVSTAAFLSTLPAESFASYLNRPDFTTIDKSVEGAVKSIRDGKWATEMHVRALACHAKKCIVTVNFENLHVHIYPSTVPNTGECEMCTTLAPLKKRNTRDFFDIMWDVETVFLMYQFKPGHYWFTWPLGENIEQDKEAMQLALALVQHGAKHIDVLRARAKADMYKRPLSVVAENEFYN
eukprot:gene6350-2977_t